MRKKITFGALALSIMLTGCATIISGSQQTVRFVSNPPAATIFVDAVEVGKTPLEMKVTRNREHMVKFELDGYQLYQTRLTQKFNGWCFGNILIGGLIGIVVDVSTGAMYTLSPSVINVDMSNGTIADNPAVIEQKNTTKVENTTGQLNVGDQVKFYSYRMNSTINGLVKGINGETILIEYESFGKIKTIEISKTDIKRI